MLFVSNQNEILKSFSVVCGENTESAGKKRGRVAEKMSDYYNKAFSINQAAIAAAVAYAGTLHSLPCFYGLGRK